MLVAFDLDDTLVPTTREFSVGSATGPAPYNVVFRERIRAGGVKLLRHIGAKHELAVYTTSLRSPIYIRAWFWSLGIKLNQVINADTHASAVQNTDYRTFTKAPKLFGIDVLMDDAPGVLLECQKQGCRCILVEPQDINWTHSVLEALDC